MNSKRILIVDDEVNITRVVKLYLEKEGYQVAVSHNGKGALEMFRTFKPDLIILDLMLPDLSGEEVCEVIRTKSSVPIIMLTAKIDEEYIVNGLSIGADDYIVKPFRPKELLARIETIFRRSQSSYDSGGGLYFNEDELIIQSKRRSVILQGIELKLTAIEFDLLYLLASHKGQALSREVIIERLHGYGYDCYDRVVDSHIKNIRKKLVSSNHKYIVTVHGVGYKFEGD